MMLDCKQDEKGERDDKGERGEEKPVYISSPRKRLNQLKMQAKAIDEEVSPNAHHYHHIMFVIMFIIMFIIIFINIMFIIISLSSYHVYQYIMFIIIIIVVTIIVSAFQTK